MLNAREILLLDDNEIANYYNQDIVEDTLLFDRVLVYTNPYEALEQLTERVNGYSTLPGTMIIDIQMPEMTGFEFLEKLEPLLSKQDEIPKIFILTTSSHKRDYDQFLKSKIAKGYLNKPLTADTLLERIFSE